MVGDHVFNLVQISLWISRFRTLNPLGSEKYSMSENGQHFAGGLAMFFLKEENHLEENDVVFL
jgi:hypothetical protein